MNIPCPNAIRCPGSDFPVANFSSEDPDQQIFIGVSYGWDNNVPPLGQTWNTPGCLSWCISKISQEDADVCAARQQILCSTGNGPDVLDDGSSDPNLPTFPPELPHLYRNTVQTCSVTCPDGTPFTGQVDAGEVMAYSQVKADQIAHSLACKRAAANKICITPFDGFSCLDIANIVPEIFQQLTATSPTPIVSWSVVGGSLPPGWVLENSGLLHGFPDSAGTFNFTVKATNLTGSSNTDDMTMTVMGFTTNFDLPDGKVGTFYSQQLAATGGALPDSFAITAGTLPSGLSMDEFGLISGIPTSPIDNDTFTVSVGDLALHTCTQEFIIDITGVHYEICSYNTLILPQMVDPGTCSASVDPAWNGVFDHQTTWDVGSPMFYFINQSILGKKAAASDAPNYPNGDWQNLDSFSSLYYDSTGSQWLCLLTCTNGALIFGGAMASVDPTDPTGDYTVLTSGPIRHFEIIKTTDINKCCPDWSQLAWGVPLIIINGAGSSASFVPNSTSDYNYQALAFAPSPITTHNATAFNTGTFNYNGPACNCNLHAVVTWIETGAGNSVITVVISVNAVNVLVHQFVASGTFDLPFTVPDTGGVSVPILVTVTSQCRNFTTVAGATTANQTGRITNV